MRKTLLSLAACLLLAGPAAANQIVLEGSDATTFHQDVLYTTQLLTFMQVSAGSSLPVLKLGTGSFNGSIPASLYNTGSTSGYALNGTNLALYSGVYITSPFGCCGSALGLISAGDAALIGAAQAAGLSLTIQDYEGGNWGAILSAIPGLNAVSSADIITGVCTDREIFNANGLARGFVQPPVLSCYEHQAYRTSTFGALGFLSLVDADPTLFGPAGAGSALLAIGGVLGTPAGVPEPASLLLIGSGLAGLVARRRRKV